MQPSIFAHITVTDVGLGLGLFVLGLLVGALLVGRLRSSIR